jgi:hypothetical protein
VTVPKCRPDTEAKTSRALMVRARTLEQLDIRQVAEHLRTTGGRLTSMELIPLEVAGHGAGTGWVWAAGAGRWCVRQQVIVCRGPVCRNRAPWPSLAQGAGGETLAHLGPPQRVGAFTSVHDRH